MTGNAKNKVLRGLVHHTYGVDGASAYEIALKNGFEGTEAEWLESLKGDQGIPGTKGEHGDKGDKGDKGEKGDAGTGATVVQTTGSSTDDVMSQKAVTEEITQLLDDFSTFTVTGTNVRVYSDKERRAIISTDEPTSITHVGKNMLAQPYDTDRFYGSPFSSYGVTYTKNEDGSIHGVGTATGTSMYYFVGTETSNRRPIKKGTYTFSGCPLGGGNSTYFSTIGITGVGEFYDKGDGVTITVNEDTTYYFHFRVVSGATVDIVVKPQLELSYSKTEWTPYNGETINAVVGKNLVKVFEGVNHYTADKELALAYCKDEVKTMLNIKDFGAIGDGVTDDTVAINAALTQATNKILYVPEGVYLFSGTLQVHGGTKIIGCGERSVFKLADKYSLDSIVWRAENTGNAAKKYPMILLDEDSNGCMLNNFTLIGSSTWKDENQDGIAVRGSNHILENLLVHNINYSNDKFSGRWCLCPAWGINIFKASVVSVRNCHVYDCGYENIGTEEAEIVTISDCSFGDACQCGAQVHRLSKHIKFYGNTVYQTENIRSTDCAAFTMDASVGVDIDDVIVANNTFGRHVNTVGGGENNIKIIGNHIDGIMYTNTSVNYGKGLIICDNYINGRINMRADDVMVANNILNNPTGNYMIRIYGNNVSINNNLGVGAGKETTTVGH